MDRRTFASAEDGPEVSATVAGLRAGVLAVTLGCCCMFALAAIAVHATWQAGVERGAAAAARGGGASSFRDTLGVVQPVLALLAGCIALAIVMIVAVRRPLARAREQAIELAEADARLASNTLETFAALGAAIEAKDHYTAGHGLRVTLVSILIGQELGLSDAELDVLRRAATFHDIGKIAVPDVVLQTPGVLNDSEFEAMKVHPAEGARICSKLQALRDAVPLVRSHHERVDGRGYPDNLVGDQIPLGARIIAVADSWDAVTSDRPYRRGQPAFVALEEIRRCCGSHFDEGVVRAFIEVLARDPWMFGLTPEDIERRRPLPAPVPASRGVDEASAGYEPIDADGRSIITATQRDTDWSRGFSADDLRAS